MSILQDIQEIRKRRESFVQAIAALDGELAMIRDAVALPSEEPAAPAAPAGTSRRGPYKPRKPKAHRPRRDSHAGTSAEGYAIDVEAPTERPAASSKRPPAMSLTSPRGPLQGYRGQALAFLYRVKRASTAAIAKDLDIVVGQACGVMVKLIRDGYAVRVAARGEYKITTLGETAYEGQGQSAKIETLRAGIKAEAGAE